MFKILKYCSFIPNLNWNSKIHLRRFEIPFCKFSTIWNFVQLSIKILQKTASVYWMSAYRDIKLCRKRGTKVTTLTCFFFFKFFVWTKVHFVEPLIAPVLDFVCPSSWVSNPEWIACLHSFLLACCDPEGHIWCDTCLFHQ